MAEELSTARLPYFTVDGRTWHSTLQTDPQLTRVVSTNNRRHSYLAPPSVPPYMRPAVYRALLRLLQRNRVAKALDEMALHAAKQIGERPVGYLARVNLGVDSEGNTILLPGELMTGIGFGVEPLDALAEAHRTPQLQQGGVTVRKISYYVWYNRSPDGVYTSTLSDELSRALDEQAVVEAHRRHLLGEAFRKGGPNGVEQARAAEYWREFATRQTQVSERAESYGRLAELNARMMAAQDAFNSAYENYQTINREMANNAAEMQTLGKIGAVLNLLGSGSAALDSARAWRAARAQGLTQQQGSQRASAEAARTDVVAAQDALQAEWGQAGAQTWAPPRIPQVTPPPNIPPPEDIWSPQTSDTVIRVPDLM